VLGNSDTVRFERISVLGYTTDSRSIVLTNLGEKMSDDEVDELLKAVDTSSGEINYMGTSEQVADVNNC
jgi:Ca2+-binding EF-hand superfamily protein